MYRSRHRSCSTRTGQRRPVAARRPVSPVVRRAARSRITNRRRFEASQSGQARTAPPRLHPRPGRGAPPMTVMRGTSSARRPIGPGRWSRGGGGHTSRDHRPGNRTSGPPGKEVVRFPPTVHIAVTATCCRELTSRAQRDPLGLGPPPDLGDPTVTSRPRVGIPNLGPPPTPATVARPGHGEVFTAADTGRWAYRRCRCTTAPVQQRAVPRADPGGPIRLLKRRPRPVPGPCSVHHRRPGPAAGGGAVESVHARHHTRRVARSHTAGVPAASALRRHRPGYRSSRTTPGDTGTAPAG